MITIKNPCCCASLKTGALVFAVFDIIAGISFVFNSLKVLKPDLFPFLATALPTTATGEIEDAEPISAYMMVVLIITLLVGVCAIAFGLLLLQAIRTDATPLMVAWVIFRVVVLVIYIGLAGVGLIITYSESKLLEFGLGVFVNCWMISVICYLRKAILLNTDNSAEKPLFKESKPLHVLRTEYTYKIPI